MSLSEAEETQLQDYQFMMGPAAGSLAFVLDRLTDVMALIGQHKVYCRVEKGPRAGQPPLDIQEIVDILQKAKDLAQQTMLDLRKVDNSPQNP